MLTYHYEYIHLKISIILDYVITDSIQNNDLNLSEVNNYSQITVNYDQRTQTITYCVHLIVIIFYQYNLPVKMFNTTVIISCNKIFK